jgi:hypothetical protein
MAPWEGHINRLKVIKRQMYGRGGFELLKARVLPLTLPAAAEPAPKLRKNRFKCSATAAGTNPEGFQKQVGALLERVGASRRIYAEMLAKAIAELQAREASSQ